MKTVNIDGASFDVTYRTNSEMRTKARFTGKTYTQGLSCDVYSVEDGVHIALVLTTVNGDILNSTTLMSLDEYEAIADLYDPTAGGRYHTALLERCGAENYLQIH